jgi:DNA-binding SARP family transcriptional activator
VGVGRLVASRVEPRLEEAETGRDSDPAPTQLTLLGGFAVSCSDVEVSLPSSAHRLVAFLALQERPVSRSFAAGSLWSESTEEHAIGSLRSALWRVRRDPARRLVEAAGTSLRLAANVSVDLHTMTGFARRLISGTEASDRLRMDAVLTEDLLPDWYDDWVIMPRERNRQLRLHALEALAAQLADRGKYAEAVEAGLAAVEGEPLRDSAHAVLIRVHLSEGNRLEALRQYDRYRGIMRSSLGLGPSAELEALVAGLTTP